MPPTADPRRQCPQGCGHCCDPVILRFDPLSMDGPSAPFAREHWSTIDVIETDVGLAWRVRCDQFDPCSRTCQAYEGRPPICAGYPWYGRQPEPYTPDRLYPICAFQADKRTMLPLMVIVRPIGKTP